MTTAALTKSKIIWSEIAFSSKIRLMHTLVMSIFLHAFETWTIRHSCSWTFFTLIS
uniref:Uncharacterized protein n=1 Tax=Cyprinus carpio TaxID=7962 RepID=A0A8C1TDP8_CYPCA